LPNRDRELPVDGGEEPSTVPFERPKAKFGLAVRREIDPLPRQPPTMVGRIVDLAGQRRDVAAVSVGAGVKLAAAPPEREARQRGLGRCPAFLAIPIVLADGCEPPPDFARCRPA